MQPISLPKAKRSAKDFLLRLTPKVLWVFDVPQTIYGFNVHTILTKEIYAMSEETAEHKLKALKELLAEW